MKVVRRRLDLMLVERGLAESREKARAMLLAGVVSMGGRRVLKPGSLVSEEEHISVREVLPYVGRGGIKLAHALDQFELDVSRKVALDVGASTGGFTDCLLQRGARKVYALDVGYGQLDYRLRSDPRVVVMERINARYPFTLPERVGLAVADVSFISLTKVLPSVEEHLSQEGIVLALIKPQFEARRGEVGRGGIIRDSRTHASVLGRFILWAVERRLRVLGLTPSPIPGSEGNREFFILLRPSFGAS